MCTSDQWWEQLRRRIVSGSRTSCWARCRCRGPNLTQHLCGEEPIWKTPLTSPSSNYDMRRQDNTCFIMQCHNRTGCVDARVKLKKKKNNILKFCFEEQWARLFWLSICDGSNPSQDVINLFVCRLRLGPVFLLLSAHITTQSWDFSNWTLKCLH